LAAIHGSVAPNGRVFVVLAEPPPASSPLASLTAVSEPEGWLVYELTSL
jgi:hypothetical protein